MVTLEEALAKVRDAAGPPRLVAERVALDDAFGRVLAADVAMDHDVPPFRRSLRDGYAVPDGVEVGVRLAVLGRVRAGTWPDMEVGPGYAVRIMTGAPVPEGTARVIPFEWTSETDGEVLIERIEAANDYTLDRGRLRAGALVLEAGRKIDPGAVAVLATAGAAEVEVARRPRVAVLATGSELVPVDEVPGPGRIRNSNSFLLRAQVRRAGAVPMDLGTALDDVDALRARIREGLSADVIVLSGGVSRGDFDLVPDALEAEGVTTVFHRWGVQPGGPLWFGTKDETLVFGLPGNPAGSFVGFEMLVVPAIGGRMGIPIEMRPTLKARCRGPWARPGGRRRFRPARLVTADDGVLEVERLPWSGSGDPSAAALAEALVALPFGPDEEGGDLAIADVVLLEVRR